MKQRIFISLLLLISCLSLRAQKVAIKSNLLSDAALCPNFGVEIGIAPRWTLDLSGQLNLWPINDHKWCHWAVLPEARYWFCDRFSGHFVGAHLVGGQYNVGGIDLPFSLLGTDFRKLKDTRYQGWFAGLGVAYGYAWALSEHWNLEGEIGLGWTYTRFDRFRCAGCGQKIEKNRPHNFFGITKAAINLVYVF